MQADSDASEAIATINRFITRSRFVTTTRVTPARAHPPVGRIAPPSAAEDAELAGAPAVMRAAGGMDGRAALRLLVPPQAERAALVGAPASVLGDVRPVARGDAVARQSEGDGLPVLVGDDHAVD